MINKNIDFDKTISLHIKNSIDSIKKIETELSNDIISAVKLIIHTFSSGNKLLIAGNGGSAADAQHIAAEFIVRLSKEFDRPALPAIALTTDSSILTAASNDFGINEIFKRQLEALAKKGDCFMVISTSGNSTNLIKALEFAQTQNITSIGLLGNDGGLIKKLVDHAIIVNHSSTQHIQETHICIYHLICDLVERSLFS